MVLLCAEGFVTCSLHDSPDRGSSVARQGPALLPHMGEHDGDTKKCCIQPNDLSGNLG